MTEQDKHYQTSLSNCLQQMRGFGLFLNAARAEQAAINERLDAQAKEIKELRERLDKASAFIKERLRT